MAEHIHAGEYNQRQNNVHGRAGDRNKKTLPARVAHEFAWIAGAALHGILASHLYIAAQRQQTNAVICVAAAEADQALAKTKAEYLNPDLEQLGYGVVA